MSGNTEANVGHAGFAAIAGRPNAGKSTLLNALLGTKLAIVSHHPQTTRNRILGVRSTDTTQIVFIDTPGIHRGTAQMSKLLVQEAVAGLEGVDSVLFVTDAQRAERKRSSTVDPADRYALKRVTSQPRVPPIVVVINKIDLLRDRQGLLPQIEAWRQEGCDRVVPLSARTGEGVSSLLDEVAGLMPPGPKLYPEDMITDRAERFLAAELVREQVYRQTHHEVPYATAVEIERFEERADRADVLIEATVCVEREGQKAILIGRGGQQIKQIGERARQEIARLLDCTVHLKLNVALARDWSRTAAGRRRFGYE